MTDTTTRPSESGGTRGRGPARAHRPGWASRARRAQQPLRSARDLLTVRRAFGTPVVSGDVTLVPVARIIGGAGYGYGDGEWRRPEETDQGTGTGTGSGSGGGFGVRVTPVGVYAVRGSDVTWQPTFDLTRVILGGQVVGLLTVWLVTRAVRRRRR